MDLASAFWESLLTEPGIPQGAHLKVTLEVTPTAAWEATGLLPLGREEGFHSCTAFQRTRWFLASYFLESNLPLRVELVMVVCLHQQEA